MPPSSSVQKISADFEVSAGTIRDSFQGWLHTVAPTAKTTSAIVFATKISRLSVLDIIRVNYATIREGESHCIWPPFAVLRFLNAEVITTRKAEHYQLKDANLRRVS